MTTNGSTALLTDVEATLETLAANDATQSNCMFQLALMLARIAIEPVSEGFKDDTAQALMALIRAKPKSNVLRMFGDGPLPDPPPVLRVAIA